MDYRALNEIMRIWVYNSGFFYTRTMEPSTVKRFSGKSFFPFTPGYIGLYASGRTMDIYQFMKSNVLFKTVKKL